MIEAHLRFIEPAHAILAGSSIPNTKLALIQSENNSKFQSGTFFTDNTGTFEVDLKFANTSQRPMRTFWVSGLNDESEQFRVNVVTMEGASLAQINAGVPPLLPVKRHPPELPGGVNQALSRIPKQRAKQQGGITTI